MADADDYLFVDRFNDTVRWRTDAEADDVVAAMPDEPDFPEQDRWDDIDAYAEFGDASGAVGSYRSSFRRLMADDRFPEHTTFFYAILDDGDNGYMIDFYQDNAGGIVPSSTYRDHGDNEVVYSALPDQNKMVHFFRHTAPSFLPEDHAEQYAQEIVDEHGDAL